MQRFEWNMLELMTAWIVILWRFAATYVRAKYNRAEMLNSNTPLVAKIYLFPWLWL